MELLNNNDKLENIFEKITFIIIFLFVTSRKVQIISGIIYFLFVLIEFQNSPQISSQHEYITQQTITSDVTQKTFKIKRPRMVYSSSQMLYLEHLFAKNKYLERTKRLYVARQLNLSERQIKIWYQNKRMKLKRIQKKAS